MTRITTELEDVLEIIRDVARHEVGITRPVEPADDLIADLELDSLTMVTLLAAIENACQVKLPSDPSELRTIADLASLVVRLSAPADHSVAGISAPRPGARTVHDVLAAAAATEAGLVFVDSREHEAMLGYRELYARARRVAYALHEYGVRPGDRVGIATPTSAGFMDAFFGTILAGAVATPLCSAPRFRRDEGYRLGITRQLASIGARLCLADARTATALEKTDDFNPPFAVRTPEELLERSLGRELQVGVAPDALALIQFSSGSTSAPKGVALTHDALVMQTAMLDVIFTEDPPVSHTMVSWLPLYHDMGLIGTLLLPMFMKIPAVLLTPEAFITRPITWLHAITRHGGTITTAPNFAYDLCLRRIPDPVAAGVRLDTLRRALNGAEPVSASVMERFHERFSACGLRAGALRPVYGLAEATLAVTHPVVPRSPVRVVAIDPEALARDRRVVPGARRLVSVGQPMPGVTIQIRDEAGVAVGERHAGRIFVKSPSLMRGYYDNLEATVQALSAGWLDTGDLGFIDDGELFIAGRAKDLVIIRGANYPPQDFEECLDSVEGVRRGRVVAAGFVPEGEDSEELVVLAERAAADVDDGELEKQIRAAILERMGVRAHTVALLRKGTLRLTTSGKLRRRDALERFLVKEIGAHDAPMPLQPS
jgi:fatty-acyl-CoA synthase